MSLFIQCPTDLFVDIRACIINSSGASITVHLLPGADLHRDVAAQQQLSISSLSPQPPARLLRARPARHAQHG